MQDSTPLRIDEGQWPKFDLQLFTSKPLNAAAVQQLSDAVNAIGNLFPAEYLENLTVSSTGYNELTWSTALQRFTQS